MSSRDEMDGMGWGGFTRIVDTQRSLVLPDG